MNVSLMRKAWRRKAFPDGEFKRQGDREGLPHAFPVVISPSHSSSSVCNEVKTLSLVVQSRPAAGRPVQHGGQRPIWALEGFSRRMEPSDST